MSELEELIELEKEVDDDLREAFLLNARLNTLEIRLQEKNSIEYYVLPKSFIRLLTKTWLSTLLKRPTISTPMPRMRPLWFKRSSSIQILISLLIIIILFVICLFTIFGLSP